MSILSKSTKEIIDTINRAVDSLIKNCPNVGWSNESSDNLMSQMSSIIVAALGLSRKHLSDLIQYREEFEEQMKRKYGVNYYEDIEAEYKKRNVPQKEQVFSGYLDCLIGKLLTK